MRLARGPAVQARRHGAHDHDRGRAHRSIIGGVLIDGEVRGGSGSRPSRPSSPATRSTRSSPGFDDIPDDEHRPANIVHWSFQTMVGAGTAMIAIGGWWWLRRRRDDSDDGFGVFESIWDLPAASRPARPCSPSRPGGSRPRSADNRGSSAGLMRTEDAVTTNSGVWISLVVMVVVYASMAVIAAGPARRIARRRSPRRSRLRSPTRTGRAASWSHPDDTGRSMNVASLAAALLSLGTCSRSWRRRAAAAAVWDLLAGDAHEGAPSRPDRPLDRSVWETDTVLARLRAGVPLDQVPDHLRRDHDVVVRPMAARRSRHRAPRRCVRVVSSPRRSPRHSSTASSSPRRRSSPRSSSG